MPRYCGLSSSNLESGPQTEQGHDATRTGVGSWVMRGTGPEDRYPGPISSLALVADRVRRQ